MHDNLSTHDLLVFALVEVGQRNLPDMIAVYLKSSEASF